MQKARATRAAIQTAKTAAVVGLLVRVPAAMAYWEDLGPAKSIAAKGYSWVWGLVAYTIAIFGLAAVFAILTGGDSAKDKLMRFLLGAGAFAAIAFILQALGITPPLTSLS